MKIKALVIVIASFLAAALALEPAWAQKETPYPTRQINYLICFDPGGQSDRVARLQQPHLERFLGQKVLIDYKVGGGGALGWRELVRAKPDGYLMAGFNIPHTILQPLQQEVGYKTEQINPVSLFQRTPLGLAVLNTSQYKTLQEFIDFGKKNPGALTIGGSGTFSGYHMAALRLEKLSGVKVTYVPFTGSAPQMAAFLGGHLAAIFGASDDLTRFRDKLRVLGFATESRFPGFPEAPTLKEGGIDMAEAVDRGAAVPPKTPDYIIKKLESAFVETARHPDVVGEMKKQGFIPIAMGHEESRIYHEKNHPLNNYRSSPAIDFMKTQRSADIETGYFLILLGLLVVYAASKITGGLEERLPPRTLPYIVGALILICGALLTIKSWRFRGENAQINWPNRTSLPRILISLFALVVYIALMEPLGLAFSTFLFISFSVWYLGRYRILYSLLVGFVAGGASYFIFIYLLGLSFPLGPFLIR